VGFELIATTSEETIDAKRTMPKAIIITLAICGSLYVLISLAVVKLVP
jgi:APA family basic amino acid/polyamine antiporter